MRTSPSRSMAASAPTCQVPCTPAPKSATFDAPERASAVTPSAPAAAVRIAVISDESRMARSAPVSRSMRWMAPRKNGSPAAGLASVLALTLTV